MTEQRIEEEKYKLKLEELKLREESRMYEADQKYEKYIVALSAGALPLSVTIFLHFQDALPETALPWVFVAWFSWILSVLVVVLSLKTSYKSHRKAIEQISDDAALDRVYDDKEILGGCWRWWTNFFSNSALVLFVIGTVAFLAFATITMKGELMSDKDKGNGGQQGGGSSGQQINDGTKKASVPEKSTLPTRPPKENK